MFISFKILRCHPRSSLSIRVTPRTEVVKIEKRKKSSRGWKWVESLVDSEEEHIKITYGDDAIPVALVAPRGKRAFMVQFVLRADPSPAEPYQKILEETRDQLDFFLIEKGEENPWAYAIYHCSTASNFYSRVRWDRKDCTSG